MNNLYKLTDSNNNINFAADPPKSFEEFLQLSQMVSKIRSPSPVVSNPNLNLTGHNLAKNRLFRLFNRSFPIPVIFRRSITEYYM